MNRNLKILAICESIDLRDGKGMTPFFWQIFKSLSDLEVNVLVAPVKGRSVESLWWRCYDNPTPSSVIYGFIQSVYSGISRPLGLNLIRYTQVKNVYNNSLQFHSREVLKSLGKSLKTWYMSRPKSWNQLVDTVWKREGGINAVVILSCPLDYMRSIPKYVHAHYGIPVIAYDADLPTYLWNQSNYSSSHYYKVELNDYDAFVVNSKGVAGKLKEKGMSNVYVLHFCADPRLFSPIKIEQDIDVSFYGYGESLREWAMREMIALPSKELNLVFRTAGSFGIDLGFSKNVGHLEFAAMKRFCCRSKINLNITRRTFAETYASSTSRPFELASMECCIVSNPCKGLEEWFIPGKEIFIAKNKTEAIELYKWLTSSPEIRWRTGKNARERVLREHTFEHRAQEFLKILDRLV